VRIDHVIWTTADLDATAERFVGEHGLPDGGAAATSLRAAGLGFGAVIR
jgi:hypothetical protein